MLSIDSHVGALCLSKARTKKRQFERECWGCLCDECQTSVTGQEDSIRLVVAEWHGAGMTWSIELGASVANKEHHERGRVWDL